MKFKYKFAVELLISNLESFIYDNDLDMEYKKEVDNLYKRIEIVRKFENDENGKEGLNETT